MGRLNNVAHRAVATVERDKKLDKIAGPVASAVRKATRGTSMKNALSGTWLGHQLHPALTDLPIGSWVAATTLDLIGGDKSADAARHLVGLGVVTAIPAAASGASDWADSYGGPQRVGLVHAAANGAGTLLQVWSWIARRRGARGLAVALSLAGLGLTLGAAYLGGHLSFARGVGVNHTAFEQDAAKWTDVAAATDLTDTEPLRVTAAGVPVVLVKAGDKIHALSATCTHAGGPLDQGRIDSSGCVVCPWHGSKFRIETGEVERGPATVPQPMWDAKVENDRVWVRSAAA